MRRFPLSSVVESDIPGLIPRMRGKLSQMRGIFYASSILSSPLSSKYAAAALATETKLAFERNGEPHRSKSVPPTARLFKKENTFRDTVGYQLRT
jgi:hypothetical protein